MTFLFTVTMCTLLSAYEIEIIAVLIYTMMMLIEYLNVCLVTSGVTLLNLFALGQEKTASSTVQAYCQVLGLDHHCRYGLYSFPFNSSA